MRIIGDIVGPNLDITVSVKMKQAMAEFVCLYTEGCFEE